MDHCDCRMREIERGKVDYERRLVVHLFQSVGSFDPGTEELWNSYLGGKIIMVWCEG